MTRAPHVVGIGGTTRAGSTSEKALRFTLRVCEQEGASTRSFGAEELVRLPHFAPEGPERDDVARALVEELRRADCIVIASPGYHGSVSGLVKNALDYTEDMREDPRPYFAERAVGLIAAGAGWQAAVTTLEALRAIVHALRGWATPLGAAINSTQPSFGPDGEPADERIALQLTTVAQEVVAFARWRIAALETTR